MPRALHHGAMVAFDERVYIFGGFVLPQAGPPVLPGQPADAVLRHDPLPRQAEPVTALW